MKTFGLSLFAVSVFFSIGILGYGITKSIDFERGCSGHLKRAADANTIDLAEQELALAVKYIESNGLTSGDTSLFYSMPENELDFWYANLKASLEELQSTPAEADRLTMSNQLIKLRETIMDGHEKGARVTVPPNAFVFPNQLTYRMLGGAALAGILLGGTQWISQMDGSTKSCG